MSLCTGVIYHSQLHCCKSVNGSTYEQLTMKMSSSAVDGLAVCSETPEHKHSTSPYSTHVACVNV